MSAVNPSATTGTKPAVLPASSFTFSDTPITLKITYNGTVNRVKLPFSDMDPSRLQEKIKVALGIDPETACLIERFSDSSAAFVTINNENTAVFKQLQRAAKSKRRLKLRVSPIMDDHTNNVDVETSEPKPSKNSYEPASSVPNVAPATPDVQSPENIRILCDRCDSEATDGHYHCSECDNGDFDICNNCYLSGQTCRDPSHTLRSRRFSTNEAIAAPKLTRLSSPPRKPSQSTVEDCPKRLPSQSPYSCSSTNNIPMSCNRCLVCLHVKQDCVCSSGDYKRYHQTRTCNCCIAEMYEKDMVNCSDCPDYDICRACLVKGIHGHHPAHTFVAVDCSAFRFDDEVQRLLPAGRNKNHGVRCKTCLHLIVGIRHRCIECPDFDMCNHCVVNAASTHPGHSFVPIYDNLAVDDSRFVSIIHTGVRCSGPLCRNSSQDIRGIRYKCAVCSDINFCSNCEALPPNTHNRTHPLIKMKTPIQSVSVSTLHEPLQGRTVALGDHVNRSNSVSSTSVAIQTLVDVEPQVSPHSSKSAPETTQKLGILRVDSTPTRKTVLSGETFMQKVMLKNTGSIHWPAGCSVKYFGNVSSAAKTLSSDEAEFIMIDTIPNAMALKSGEMFTFALILRAPTQAGEYSISCFFTDPMGNQLEPRMEYDVSVVEPERKSVDRIDRQPTMIFPKLPAVSSTKNSVATENVAQWACGSPDALGEEYDQVAIENEDDDDFSGDWSCDDRVLSDDEYSLVDASEA